MFTLHTVLLIIISSLLFLLGYAFLADKAENIIMWSFTGKSQRIKDKQGYKKQQGKHCITVATIFLLVPVSIYIVDSLNINKNLLLLWYVVLIWETILNAFKTRKYFK